MRKIICIGRQYGSGGHTLAHQLAERLGIPYYDKIIVEHAIEKTGMKAEILQKAEERLSNPLLHSIYYEGADPQYYGKNSSEILYLAQSELILEYAEKSDCIIVGRCADVVLKENTDYAVKSIFVNAPMDYRIETTMQKEHLDSKAAAAQIRKADKARSAYYNYYTGHDWGKASDYDYCVNMATNAREDILDLCLGIYQRMGEQ